MHRSWWALGVALPFAWIAAACGSSHPGLNGDGSDNGGTQMGDDASGGGMLSNNGSSGTFTNSGTSAPQPVNDGPCKGGKYGGTFAGSYTSHLTGVGIPIPVTGNVDLTLEQEGTSKMMCMSVGEVPVPCSDVFSLQNGTITGVADGAQVGDATVGGFPYYCTMTGTLDCPNKKLDNGWIQCTYCIGPLADGGMSCSLLDGVGGTTGVGGHFAGPLVANYDYGTLSFVMGTWNGAEALAGNDGGSPGPEGGPIADYLTDGGLYLGPNDFGGIGTWNATYGK
jgi:hypothetical protein